MKETDSNHTGEVINRVNLHVHNTLQRGEISQNTVSTSQLTMTELDNFTCCLKSRRTHYMHQEDL